MSENNTFPSENKELGEAQFREPSIAEQPGEQDVEVEWFKQCAKAEERIQELEHLLKEAKTHILPSYCELRDRINKALTPSQPKDVNTTE